MHNRNPRPAYAVLSAALFALFAGTSLAAPEEDCNKCHQAMSKGNNLHAAMKKGCGACHVAPHADKDRPTLSLRAEQPALCYECHNKALFLRRYEHKPTVTGK